MPTTVFLLLCGLCLAPALVAADELRIAVAANFVPTLQRLSDIFASETGHRVLLSSASTGKHYAQIRNGAAFDIFLAADAERPELLEREGIGVAGSRFVYARGRLALWAPGFAAIDDAAAFLAAGRFRRFAIAHPRLAPYGRAAQQVLERWGLWDGLQSRLVRGENIGQTFQFVATGNAQAGLIALSQLLQVAEAERGGYQSIPEELHAPIVQQALQLRPGAAAESFLDFLRGGRAAAEIRDAGYLVAQP